MSPLVFAASGYLALLSDPLTLIDIREHRLPNPLTLSAIGISGALVAADALIWDWYLQLLFGIGLATTTWFVGLMLGYLDQIGMGDVKLLVSMHLILGYLNPWLVLIELVIGFTLASLVSLTLLILRKMTLKSSLPMGPYLLVGFFVSFGIGITGAA